MISSIWSSVRLRFGIPRYFPPLRSLSASLENIGFIAGALRIHERSSASLKHSGVTPRRYSAPNSSGLASCSFFRQSSVSRSHVAPANVVRVMRWVKLGALPDTMYRSGGGLLGFSELDPSAFSSIRPLTWWQREHWALNVSSPRSAFSSVGFSAGCNWLATHVE